MSSEVYVGSNPNPMVILMLEYDFVERLLKWREQKEVMCIAS